MVILMGVFNPRITKANLSVIPSLAVMALQSMVLGGEGNGFAIAPFKALSMRGDHPKVAVIVSVLFPLMVWSG